MRINLFNDYRGELTREFYYRAGVLDVDADIAAALVEAGRAEYVAPEPEPAAPVKITKRGARK
jgi:hypothetical protein